MSSTDDELRSGRNDVDSAIFVHPETVQLIKDWASGDCDRCGHIEHPRIVHRLVQNKFDVKGTYFLGYDDGYYAITRKDPSKPSYQVEGLCLSYRRLRNTVRNSAKKEDWFFITSGSRINHKVLKQVSKNKSLYGELILQLQRYSVVEDVTFYYSLTQKVIESEIQDRGVEGYVEMFNSQSSRSEFLEKIYQEFLSLLNDHKLELLNTARKIALLTERYWTSPLRIVGEMIDESCRYARIQFSYPDDFSYYHFRDKFFEILEDYPAFRKRLLEKRYCSSSRSNPAETYLNPYDQPYLEESPNVTLAESNKKPSLDQIERGVWWYKS